ncbi:MAG: transposase [Rubrivivax sp.]
MARLARFPGAGLAHHVVQHGHNGALIVCDEEDRRIWRALLAEALATTRVALHAWVLLPDHFHLVMTPAAEGDLGRLMQSLGRRYVASFNRRHRRSGTLWDGRYRACLLEPGAQVLSNLLFVDTHLHRRGAPEDEAADASSLRHHLGGNRDALLLDPPEWWSLGNTPFERQAAYARLIEAGLPTEEVGRIAAAVRRGWPLGSSRFVADLAARTGSAAAPRPRGRPPRVPGR